MLSPEVWGLITVALLILWCWSALQCQKEIDEREQNKGTHKSKTE